MKINYCLQSSLIPLILAVASVNAQSQPKTDPYVPVYVDCPKNLTVRNASEVCITYTNILQLWLTASRVSRAPNRHGEIIVQKS